MNRENARRGHLRHCIAALALSLATESVPAYDWLQFGGDPQHSGNNTAETALTPANVSALVQKYQVTLPATADSTPVFLEGVTTSSGVKDLLFVRTRDGRLIALDAQNGAQVWSHQYGAGTCQINGTGGACYTTSSPAIDPSGDYVYSYGLDGNVHKYQVGDGTEIIGGGWPQLATLKGFDEKGSSALAIATSNGVSYLYVVHGGYPGDNGDYQGHVTAINLATGSQTGVNAACSDQAVHLKHFADSVPPICATPRNAIWSRPGIIYDAGTDRIFMGTGNGVYDGVHHWSESVIALHPDGTGGSGADAGKPLDSYTASNFQTLDNGDTDLGSTAPAILPVPANSTVQHLAVQGGKDAKLRLLDLANLSGKGGPGYTGGEIGAIINVPQGGVVLTQPAVWINPADGSTWIFVVNGNGASGLRLNFDANGNPSLAPQWQNVQGGTSPVVANNMVFSLSGSTIRALDPLSGNVLWSLARSGGFHWESLIVANGVVYATDSSNHLTAFAIATSVTLNVTPTSIAGNGTLTASWSGISAPTATDWIGLFVPGAPSGSYIDWIYVSCSKTPNAPVAAGSCPFVLPNVAPGTYELRLLANNGFTVLATSNTFTVTGSTSLSVTPTSVATRGTVTASWNGISSPTATDWIGLFVPGDSPGS